MQKSIQRLPEKTVERLSEYRRTLLKHSFGDATHIYSHELASIQGVTAVQVRRDLMLIGFSTATKKGYNIKSLINHIEDTLDCKDVMKVAMVGMGNIATAVTSYFHNKRKNLKIVVAFDNAPDKINKEICGVMCYDINELWVRLKEYGVNILVLTLPASEVKAIADKVEDSDIKGILNFTSATITFNSDNGIFVQDYDIITLLEKVAYFSKQSILEQVSE